MKTLKQLKKEYQDCLSTIQVTSLDKKSEHGKLKKEKEKLFVLISYLETSPSETYIKSETARLENRLELISKGQPIPYGDNKSNPFHKKALALYNKENNVAHLSSQLKALLYILN